MMTMAKQSCSNAPLFIILWCLVLRYGSLLPCTAFVPLSSSPLSVPSSSSSLPLSFASTLAACPRPTIRTHMLQQGHWRLTTSTGRQQSKWGEKDKSGSRTALMALPQLLSSLSMSSLFHQLPTCTPSQVPTVALLAGITGLVTQLSLSKFFRISSYTAHTCVAFVFLLLVTTVGAVGWYSTGVVAAGSAAAGSAAASRLLLVQPAAQWLAAVVTGMMAIWDIPTSIRVKSLRKPDVLVHHILMTVISYLGATQVPTLYVFFHLGVSELSSLPLLLYDQLTHQLQGIGNVNKDDHSESHEDRDQQLRRKAKLIKARDVMEPVTAIFFTMVRAFWFTKVTLFGYVPDVLSVLRTNAAATAGKAAVLRFIMVAGIGFTALQLYWFYTQIVCALLDKVKQK